MKHLFKALQICTVVVLTLALVACGKSEEDETADLYREQNRLAAEINQSPHLDLSWSEQQLAELEGKLNRLAAVEEEIFKRKGAVTSNAAKIEIFRRAIDAVRFEKRVRAEKQRTG